MIKLHTLGPAKGSISKRKRIGRGEGSGRGGTSTRGYNGAQSRSGYARKAGFEGGQMPLHRRLPKFGFKNPNKVIAKPINLDTLNMLAKEKNITTIDAKVLCQHGLISKKDTFKILGDGVLKHSLTVITPKISKSAQAAIEKLKGTVTIQ